MNTLSANLKTGHSDCLAFFCSALCTLTLYKNANRQIIDLGFSGGRLLARLMQEPGEMIDRDTLTAYAWPNRVVGQGSLNQQIYTLRKILGDEKDRKIIQTVTRRGYRFNPAFVVDQNNGSNTEPQAGTDHASSLLAISRAEIQRKWTLRAMAAAGFVGYILTSHPSQLFASLHIMGGHTVTFVETKKDQLKQLINLTHGLSTRLVSLSKNPMELSIVTIDDQTYHIYCSGQAGANYISLNDNELHTVSDTQLRECIEGVTQPIH